MGGKALKEYGVERLSKEEYEKVAAYQKLFLEDLGVKYHIVKAYESKEDFGDMDIVISKGKDGKTYSFFQELFKDTPKVRNGSVMSVVYDHQLGGKKFQIDYIFQKEKDFDFACHYFDYNDLGNLIGRVAHKAGFKFGHDGLWYILRDGDYQVGKVCITKSFYEALYFLEFSIADYALGFKTLEDIFWYVVSNPYFDPKSYDLDSRSRYARIRDVKRPTYTAFLKWIKENVKEGKIRERTKEDWLKESFWFFPDFEKEYNNLQEKNRIRKAVREKFNGNIVMEITGLEGKELGKFISYFKTTEDDFEQWVLDSTEEWIIWTISCHYVCWGMGLVE